MPINFKVPGWLSIDMSLGWVAGQQKFGSSDCYTAILLARPVSQLGAMTSNERINNMFANSSTWSSKQEELKGRAAIHASQVGLGRYFLKILQTL